MHKTIYVYSVVSSLIGTLVFILVRYLLAKNFDLATTLAVAAFLLIGNFLSYKFLMKRKKITNK
ncbi:Uncharacterised protein [uncultured archaeon]|nr:Uncharacterised protein [uncultured archaeon]